MKYILIVITGCLTSSNAIMPGMLTTESEASDSLRHATPQEEDVLKVKMSSPTAVPTPKVTAQPTGGYTYGNVCQSLSLYKPAGSYACSDAALSLQATVAYCQSISGMFGVASDCSPQASTGGRFGCWIDLANKLCIMYSGVPTCTTPISTPDWYNWGQAIVCLKQMSNAPTSAPVPIKSKGKDGPIVKKVTFAQNCAGTAAQTPDTPFCYPPAFPTTPLGCAAAFGATAPCQVGTDPKGKGCWGDRFGNCIVYGIPPACSDTRTGFYRPMDVPGSWRVTSGCVSPIIV